MRLVVVGLANLPLGLSINNQPPALLRRSRASPPDQPEGGAVVNPYRGRFYARDKRKEKS